MAGDTLPGTSTRRRRGPAGTALALTLAAWAAEGILTGPEHAAQRSTLRDAAEAVDDARAAMRADEGTAYSLSRCVTAYAELLRLAAPDAGPAGAVDVWEPVSGDASIPD